ncbi:MAG: rod shape-determining protein RodA [Candidatus Taylorbacteria bacterium]|nr:rod shape-determining protein RodA [Candidatus Taylorbacteria bacterium]
MLRLLAKKIDWLLLTSALTLVGAGLVTMYSFEGGANAFFERQIAWTAASVLVLGICSLIDFRFLRRSRVVISIFVISCLLLLVLFGLGKAVRGSQSWFDLGPFSFQPSDPAKIALILILAKYFSRRHIEIANFRHIFISAVYAAVIFLLVFLQPDFGSAIIIFLIWLGMVLVSGISKKHLLLVAVAVLLGSMFLWFDVFEDYQKERILTFLHPYTDISGAGYNAYQSTVAVGSGEVLGKGVGYGTQSRLKFLPEYQTDFIFAAFAEEWGFVGVMLLFALFGVLIWRVLGNAAHGATNFEILFGLGMATFFISHFVIHVGMNLGILPVTGTPIPFMSYGGSHLLTEFLGLGILMGMRAYARPVHKAAYQNEFLGA